MNFLKALILLINILIISIITSSCGPTHKVETQKLDSLEMQLAQSEDNLNIEIELIQNRITEIALNRKYVMQNRKDTFTYELGVNLDRYKALMRIYQDNVDSYLHFNNELPALRKQVETLRNSLKRNEFSKEEFKKYYYQEAADIQALFEGSEKIKRSLYEMEPEYIRLSEYFDKEKASIKAQEDQ